MEPIKQTIENFIKKEKQLDKSIFNQIALYIFGQEANNTDLYFLAKLLTEKSLMDVIDFYDGEIIKPPPKKTYKECLLITICFYLYTINGWNWNEIKEFLKLPKEDGNVFKELDIIKRVESLQNELDRNLYKILKDTKFDNMQEFMDNFNSKFKLFQE